MSHIFEDAVVTAVLRHMNSDHAEDNLLIVRAFCDERATGAVMTGFDGDGGVWELSHPDGSRTPHRVPWPAGPISERAEVRREIVALYDRACERLGITPRPHD